MRNIGGDAKLYIAICGQPWIYYLASARDYGKSIGNTRNPEIFYSHECSVEFFHGKNTECKFAGCLLVVCGRLLPTDPETEGFMLPNIIDLFVSQSPKLFSSVLSKDMLTNFSSLISRLQSTDQSFASFVSECTTASWVSQMATSLGCMIMFCGMLQESCLRKKDTNVQALLRGELRLGMEKDRRARDRIQR